MQSPTNYAVEIPTFGEFTGVSTTAVQWLSLALGEQHKNLINLVFHIPFRIFIHIVLCITVMSSSFDVMSSSFDVVTHSEKFG